MARPSAEEATTLKSCYDWGALGGETMTSRDEAWALALLLTLAAMLYLAAWFIEGPPIPQPDLVVVPVEVASHPGQTRS
jgi:hypothetical protein